MKTKKILLPIAISILASACSQQSTGTRQNVQISPPPSVTAAPTPVPTPRLISQFTTKLTNKKKGRMNNINLALKLLNDNVIENEQIFSFNQTIGKTTKERGFEEAVVYVEGEKDIDYGGGVCQVSTTMYNAAKDAGLVILERHRHKGPVYYVAKGKDAAVSYGLLDLRVKNTLGFPVLIKAVLEKNDVTVMLYEKK